MGFNSGFKGLTGSDITFLAIYQQYNRNDGARCWWRSRLRHCATSQNFTVSIPDVVFGIFH